MKNIFSRKTKPWQPLLDRVDLRAYHHYFKEMTNEKWGECTKSLHEYDKLLLALLLEGKPLEKIALSLPNRGGWRKHKEGKGAIFANTQLGYGIGVLQLENNIHHLFDWQIGRIISRSQPQEEEESSAFRCPWCNRSVSLKKAKHSQ